MKTFFISDLHFGHENIMKHCNRPFSSVDEMNNEIIKRWNTKVAKNDVVYILGDVAMKAHLITEFIPKLNGIKHLITGNHDRLNSENKAMFESVQVYKEIKIEDKQVVLFHYPISEWNRKFHNSYHFHGHTHLNSFGKKGDLIFNVSADVIDFTPIEFNEILDRLK